MPKQGTLKIYSELIDIIRDYETSPIEIISGLQFNQYTTIKFCEYYSNSRYLGGNKDELGRDKPFYNIVNYRVTLAKTATDLDIKDVQITSDDPEHTIHSMLLQKEAYEWMKKTNFAYFLNKAGKTRPKYGGVLVKKVMEDKELKIEVVEWKNVATDQTNILDGAIVETHYMTPVELMKKDDVWENVREVIKLAQKSNNKSSKYSQKEEQHNTYKIIVREVTGMFPLSIYKNFEGETEEDDDEFTYTMQHYFVADISGKGIGLFCEEIDEDDFQYDYIPWEEMEGRALGRGIIEDAQQAQIWTNDSVINEKQAMDLAVRVGIKTDSKKVGANILEHDIGKVYELEKGAQMETMDFTPSALGEIDKQVEKWNDQADKATSSFDAAVGNQPPSDTPYSQTALLNQVANKPFDYRREEAGIFLTRLFEKWIIPYLVKKLYKGHLLASDFSDEELQVMDNAFATYQANQKAIEAIEDGHIVTDEDYQAAIKAFVLTMKGKRRFLQIPDGFFDDLEAKITVITSGEQKNKSAILQSLSTILGNVMQSYNPQTNSFAILDNPVMARIFGTILELSGAGISPASLGIGKPQSQTQLPQGQPPAPMQQPQGQVPQPQPSPMQVQQPT